MSEVEYEFELSPLTKTEIDVFAAFAAHDENPDFEGRLIDIITEDHVKAGIRKTFEHDPDWSEHLMPSMIRAYEKAQFMEKVVQDAAQSFLRAFGCGR